MSNVGKLMAHVNRRSPCWAAMLTRALREDRRLSLIDSDNTCWVPVSWVREWMARQ